MLRLSVLVLAACCLAAQPVKRNTSDYTIGSSIQPMVIYGEGWTQQFVITNVDFYEGGERLGGSLRFFTRDGQPWRVPVKGLGAVDQVPVNLASGGMTIIETEVSQQPQELGWAYFVQSSLEGERAIYHAVTTYRKESPGRPDLMTSVPFVDDFEDEFIIFMDNRDGKYPGVGIVNTSTRTETYTLKAYDVNGVLRKTFTRTISGRHLDWFSLLAEHPDLAGFAGHLRMRANGFSSGAAFTLQFAGNGAFTALPLVHTYGMPAN